MPENDFQSTRGPHSRRSCRGMEAATSTTLLYLSKSSALNNNFGTEKTTGLHFETSTRRHRSVWQDHAQDPKLRGCSTHQRFLKPVGRGFSEQHHDKEQNFEDDWLSAPSAHRNQLPFPAPEASTVDKLFGEISAPYKIRIIQSYMHWAPNPRPQAGALNPKPEP